jgi:hypothetical protein
MGKWVSADGGGYVNLDHVVEIEPYSSLNKQSGLVRLVLPNGEARVARGDPYTLAHASGSETVPAHAGFWVVQFFFPKEGLIDAHDIEADLIRDPVIAWHIDDFGPDPITADGTQETGNLENYCAAVYDGTRVTIAQDQSFNDLTAWCEHVRGVWRERAQSKAPAPQGTGAQTH